MKWKTYTGNIYFVICCCINSVFCFVLQFDESGFNSQTHLFSSYLFPAKRQNFDLQHTENVGEATSTLEFYSMLINNLLLQRKFTYCISFSLVARDLTMTSITCLSPSKWSLQCNFSTACLLLSLQGSSCYQHPHYVLGSSLSKCKLKI